MSGPEPGTRHEHWPGVLHNLENREPVKRTEASPGREHAREVKPRCEHVLDRHAVCTRCRATLGLDPKFMWTGAEMAAKGRRIAEEGVRWRVEGMIPIYGMLGFLVAYAKVGKTSLALALADAVARGVPFLGRSTTQARVLVLAAEDPPEYVAYLSRHISAPGDSIEVFCVPLGLDRETLERVRLLTQQGEFGLILISSWQAVIRGLVKDENDNAGAVRVVEEVKAFTRGGVPWLIDGHSGRREDQADEADPVRALRGASAAAGAADYVLSLRYAHGAFDSRRRLTGKGRFATMPPETVSYDPETGVYESLGDTRSAKREETWNQIVTTGALTEAPRTTAAIARAAGLTAKGKKASGATLRRVREAMRDRPSVLESEESTGAGKKSHYRLAPEMQGGAG